MVSTAAVGSTTDCHLGFIDLLCKLEITYHQKSCAAINSVAEREGRGGTHRRLGQLDIGDHFGSSNIICTGSSRFLFQLRCGEFSLFANENTFRGLFVQFRQHYAQSTFSLIPVK